LTTLPRRVVALSRFAGAWSFFFSAASDSSRRDPPRSASASRRSASRTLRLAPIALARSAKAFANAAGSLLTRRTEMEAEKYGSTNGRSFDDASHEPSLSSPRHSALAFARETRHAAHVAGANVHPSPSDADAGAAKHRGARSTRPPSTSSSAASAEAGTSSNERTRPLRFAFGRRTVWTPPSRLSATGSVLACVRPSPFGFVCVFRVEVIVEAPSPKTARRARVLSASSAARDASASVFSSPLRFLETEPRRSHAATSPPWGQKSSSTASRSDSRLGRHAGEAPVECLSTPFANANARHRASHRRGSARKRAPSAFCSASSPPPPPSTSMSTASGSSGCRRAAHAARWISASSRLELLAAAASSREDTHAAHASAEAKWTGHRAGDDSGPRDADGPVEGSDAAVDRAVGPSSLVISRWRASAFDADAVPCTGTARPPPPPPPPPPAPAAVSPGGVGAGAPRVVHVDLDDSRLDYAPPGFLFFRGWVPDEERPGVAIDHRDVGAGFQVTVRAGDGRGGAFSRQRRRRRSAPPRAPLFEPRRGHNRGARF
jgi:hypothetical protein